MKFSILSHVAFRSIRAHKQMYFPFLLAVSLLFALEYILLSLMQNDYVNEFHPNLSSLIGIGVFFSTLLIVIITLYTSNFIQKNQMKEFGLYTVLGLEKKHIRWISLIQTLFNWLVSSAFSVILGYLMGSLMFVGLNRLMRDTGAGLMDYPFQFETAIGTVIILFVTFFVSFLIHAFKIGRLNPTELLKKAHEGEREPKGHGWMLILGLLSLGGGYYIALTTTDVISSLVNVFLAIFLVVIGTFFLFMSLSIFILKALQNNKRIYYKPNNFLSISGMLHRMNNNAVSLSTIAILSSGVILVLGITLSLYRTMETQIENTMPYDYEIRSVDVESYENDPSENEAVLEKIISGINNHGEITDENIRTSLSFSAFLVDNILETIPGRGTPEAETMDATGQTVYVLSETLDSYNEAVQEVETLGEEEVLIASNLLDTEEFPSLEIDGIEYDTKAVSSDVIPANYGIEVIYLAFSSEEELAKVREGYPAYNIQEGYTPFPYYTSATFNVGSDKDNIDAYLSDIREENDLVIQTQETVRNNMYSLYGGLLFIGIVVSAVLIIGTILMLYFKQISEGYEDREKYRIMKQVGLPDSLIRKTIRSQIIWMFLLPIVVAITHNIFGSKIMYTLIGLFGTRDLSIFITSYFGVLVAFTLIYLIFYQLTSKSYYDIINESV